jgi:hypothetical protein
MLVFIVGCSDWTIEEEGSHDLFLDIYIYIYIYIYI